MARLTYKSLHWGTEPNRVTGMRYPVDSPAGVIGELDAISYTTKKDVAATYRHPLSRHVDPNGVRRGPYLLGPAGRAANPQAQFGHEPTEMLAVGRAVDVELVDGERVILGCGTHVTTDEQGQAIWLAWPAPYFVEVGIEQRPDGPYVTEHGIEE